MVHIHGDTASRVTTRSAGVALDRLIAVPIDTGKSAAAAMVCDFTGRRLAAPFEFALDRPGVARLGDRVAEVTPANVVLTRVGVEACGHYHRPLIGAGVMPADWQLLELNPAWVAAQRRVNGSARTKTDPTDLIAIADLLLAGRGYEIPTVESAVAELTAWVSHRRRRVEVRRAVKQQLLTQTDRLVEAARQAIPTAHAAVARTVLDADLALLDSLDGQISEAEAHIGGLVPHTAYRVLTTGPGWGTLRAAAHAATVGQLSRWPGHEQVYRAAGLNPSQYESAGRRRDGGISREGNVHLRQAILDLGVGLWHSHPASRRRAVSMRERGKPGAVITCALGRRANKIAYAMVRDGVKFDHDRWDDEQD